MSFILAFLGGPIGQIIGKMVLDAFGKVIEELYGKWRAEQIAIALGANQSTAKANAAAAEAEARMKDANAQPHTRDSAAGRLSDGIA